MTESQTEVFMKKVITLAFFPLAACGVTDPNTVEITTNDIRLSSKQVATAKSAIAEQSREPEAVRFRNLVGFKSSAGDIIVCGEVNAKNAYGGYVGYRPMWVRFNGNSIKSALWQEEYADHVLKMCAEAKIGKTMVSS